MTPRAPLFLRITTVLVLAFLHLPFLVILLYAFTSDDATYTFPLPGFTLDWFSVTWNRPDVWRALGLSLRVAAFSTSLALILGTLAALAVNSSKLAGKEAISFLLLLPIALPGIVTGIALRSAISLGQIPFSELTIVLG